MRHIYISLRSSLNWVVSFKIYVSPLSTMFFPISEFFEKSQMSEFFDVSVIAFKYLLGLAVKELSHLNPQSV